MATKMTYVDALDTALTFVDGEVAEKLTTLREQLIKRNSAKTDKPTKTQMVNEGFKERIMATLIEVGKPMTVTEIQEASPTLGVLTNQKVSALLAQLFKDGKVVKTVEKRKSYFAAATQG